MTAFGPGMRVTSSVRLVRQLGAGGMGSVWIADHLTLRTQVVVKFMAAALEIDLVLATSGSIELFVDDVSKTKLTGNLGTTYFPAGIRFVDTGLQGTSRSVATTHYMDDVAIGADHIGCQ